MEPVTEPLLLMLLLLRLDHYTTSTAAAAKQNRCDRTTLVMTKTECHSCSISFNVGCPAGYNKKIPGKGNPDCKYRVSPMASLVLSIKGCSHECYKQSCRSALLCFVHRTLAVCRAHLMGHYAVNVYLATKPLEINAYVSDSIGSINPCLQQVCHSHATCAHVGPNKHSCTCAQGYSGDGHSHCECQDGFDHLAGGVSCSLKDMCRPDSCSKNANCSTVEPNVVECTCHQGYLGNGKICYGNIMQRLNDLNSEPGGQWTGQLSNAITLFGASHCLIIGQSVTHQSCRKTPILLWDLIYMLSLSHSLYLSLSLARSLSFPPPPPPPPGAISWPLSNFGPFTVFVPINKGFKGTPLNTLMADPMKAKYLCKLHMVAGEMPYDTLNRGGIYYTLTGKAGETVTTEDDKQLKIRIHGSRKKGGFLQSDESLMKILSDYGKFSKFKDLLMKANVDSVLEEAGPSTIFAPTNTAFDAMKEGQLDYLTSSEGSTKLLELLRNHVVPSTKADVEAKNGRLYSLDGVLIPPSIEPVLPHRCDITENKLLKGDCVSCSKVTKSSCPSGVSTTPLCCKGFYGPDCTPCPGGFNTPCSRRGQCSEGIEGNGTCVCETNFKGSRCHYCSNPNKYGPACDKTCDCIHGVCDNRPEADGRCKVDSCQPGYTGQYCERHTQACGPQVTFCHAYAKCDFNGGAVKCVCKPGFQGDGITCVDTDPCAQPNRGGCDVNAKCIKTGPGSHTCHCLAGWRADEDECQPINDCLGADRGGCHPNATCIYVGPGQASCLYVSGAWKCVCEDGYTGDGEVCYGNVGQELMALPDVTEFAKWVTSTGIGGATITTANVASTNGLIHIIDTVLVPERSLSEGLLELLAQRPEFSLFRSYLVHHNLTEEIEQASAYTVFAPTDSAVLEYLKNTASDTMDLNTTRYHIVLSDRLMRIDLLGGAYKETMLGFSYQLGILPRDDKLFVNEAQVNVSDIQGGKGVIHGLSAVLDITKNRCDIQQFKTFPVRRCCGGFYGEHCEPCPGPKGQPCYGNGVCQDGTNGTGVCQCKKGFNGTAYCRCKNGRCNDGIHGDGTCECDAYWRGITCDDKITREENCGDRKCHTSAMCVVGRCECLAGFQGNGTDCKAKDACKDNNGACSPHAVCKRTLPGRRQCVCNTGYHGDGVVCVQINPCLDGRGGCHVNADCIHTGPNKTSCVCSQGYTGDGKESCTVVNLCRMKHGDCHRYARCNMTGPGERSCTCMDGYVGDGITCKGTVGKELLTRKLRDFYLGLMIADISLKGRGPFTVFAPTAEAFAQGEMAKEFRHSSKREKMAKMLRYHIVSCHTLLASDLTTPRNLTTLMGDVLTITYSEGTILINNMVKVVHSDDPSINGIIHEIDTFMIPESLKKADVIEGPLNLTDVADRNGYKTFYKLLLDTDVMAMVNDPLHQPVTLFLPSDQAMAALPQEQKDFLYNTQNRGHLLEYLKYHILRDTKVYAAELVHMDPIRTLQGSKLKANCGGLDKIGEIFLNDGNCRIIQRHLPFNGGIAYGIDCLLNPPSLGGRCDKTGNSRFPATLCILHIINTLPPWVQSQVCPGGKSSPCFNHGKCDDGHLGNGNCTCDTGFQGDACELCKEGHYGPDCTACNCTEHGSCEDGLKGTGSCFCEQGWTGQRCETQLVADLCKFWNGGCAKGAKCSQKGEKVSCTCPKGHSGDGFICRPIDPCSVDDNGGCHEHATCTMTGPVRGQPRGAMDSTVGVFHFRSTKGQYKLNYTSAQEACTGEGGTIATYTQLSYAQQVSTHTLTHTSKYTHKHIYTHIKTDTYYSL
ncbi:unnamed protein product [Coregonus sp. 'balchen']|nr:unnamed protein product [Coregonus sp. 'balchen']